VVDSEDRTMSFARTHRDVARWRAWLLEDGMVVTYTATLFLSALLMFSVQPMFAKLVLPKLGGTPSVWAVSMCFFQAMLLAGYAYAHALNSLFSARHAVFIHLSLLAFASLALPFGLPADLADPPAGDAYVWLIGVLALGVGLPFFAIAGNAPLLQAWFSQTGHPDAGDPYFLYRASNVGSLIALLTYPVLMEPAFGLASQSYLWSAGFFALALLIAVCGWQLLTKTAAPAAAVKRASANEQIITAIDWNRRAIWVALSFLPSGLIVAVTTYVTTDVASAPFLWVVPLALFLLTFILVFRDEVPVNYGYVCAALPAAVLGVVLTQSMLISSLFALAAFFLGALVCHRELYLRRPAKEQLTEFYLWMSFGGVLGGVFSALIAPHLFKSVFEFQLLALLSLLCRPGIVLGRDIALDWRRMATVVASGLALMLGYKLAVAAGVVPSDRGYLFLLVAALCIGLYLIRRWPEHAAAMVLTMIAAAAMSPADLFTLHVERSFFGTHRVTVSADGSTRMLLHGTTVHGVQILRDPSGRNIEIPTPATYYYPQGPMARGVDIARAHLASQGKTLSAAVVGLGAGSLACYSKQGEAWRFFEIDPSVVSIARDPSLFSFLPKCQPDADVIVGDARLTVSKEPAGKFGYLVIDAFSSDSIPVHLLTAEAILMLTSKLEPNGLMALHISNRHLELAPALASTIALLPELSAVLVEDRPATTSGIDFASRVVFVARDKQMLAGINALPNATPLKPTGASAWTDDYSGVLSALLRKMW
jgi:hypothetical protein